MAAQILLLILWTLGIGHTLAKHGEEKDEIFHKHNIGITLFRIAFMALILWWGGFWDCFKGT